MRVVGLQDFVTLKLVGKGAFGKVLLVKKQDTQRLYAMKVLSKEMLVQSKAVANTLTEKELLKRFDHPNIVSLKYTFQVSELLLTIPFPYANYMLDPYTFIHGARLH